MATVPLSGTHIRLMSGVPFSNDYKHSRWFDNKTQQETYFNEGGVTYVHAIDQANFQRIEGRMFIAVNKSIDELWGINYLKFRNTQFNDKWFYAFVTKLEYVQRNTTYVHFEIDVLQTWMFEMNFKPSYVVREHCKLWNADGTPVVNTVDEGLHYGQDYDVIGTDVFMPTSMLYLVIVAKSTLHVADGYPSAGYIKASMNGSAQPLSTYIHPFDVFGNSPITQIDSSIYTLPSIINLLNSIYTQESAVNNIVSMYITDHVGIDFKYENSTLIADGFSWAELKVVNIASSGTLKTIYVDSIIGYETSTIDCGKKYMPFGAVYGDTISFPDEYAESKLLMYPYSFTVLDDFKGNRIVLKNEFVGSENLEVEAMGSMGLSNKVAYIPKNYLNEKVLSPIERINIGLENALIDSSPHDVSIITDMLAAFLQGNRNSLQNQANTIAFNGVMSVVDGAVGGVASAMAGNVAGVASSATSMVKGAGNSVLQMQGLQAKVKDINNLPPSLAKMGSNTAFEYGNGYYGFRTIHKTIKPEYRKKLSDFFKMFGYKVNEVKMPNFHTRQNWNYVQTLSCNIVGNFNHEDLQELKSVFDNGITLWHTNDVGNYALPNGVI